MLEFEDAEVFAAGRAKSFGWVNCPKRIGMPRHSQEESRNSVAYKRQLSLKDCLVNAGSVPTFQKSENARFDAILATTSLGVSDLRQRLA